jgi:hypothetical protein
MVGTPIVVGDPIYSISRKGDTIVVATRSNSLNMPSIFYIPIHSPLSLVRHGRLGDCWRDHALAGFMCATEVSGGANYTFRIALLDSTQNPAMADYVTIRQDRGYTIDHDLLFVCGGISGLQILSIPPISQLVAGVSADANRGIINGVSSSPNPARGDFSISYRTSDAGDIGISIVDISGRIVYMENDRFEERGDHTRTISTNLPAGKYFARVHSSHGERVAPIVIER